MPAFTCPFCKADVDAARFLAGTQGYATGTDSGVAPCTGCGEALEFRARSGLLELGYTYSSGSLHFEAMLAVAVEGLEQQRAGGVVSIVLGGRVVSGSQDG